MKHFGLSLSALLLTAWAAAAGDAVTWTIATGTNTTAVGYADPFTGEIDEIAVYTAAGTTGAVSVVALDPYSGSALVLATNAAATGYVVWTPRVTGAAIGGDASRAVTNAPTADRFAAQGDSLYATVGGASKTGTTFRVRLKIR
jgi:hypothetical protein